MSDRQQVSGPPGSARCQCSESIRKTEEKALLHISIDFLVAGEPAFRGHQTASQKQIW